MYVIQNRLSAQHVSSEDFSRRLHVVRKENGKHNNLRDKNKKMRITNLVILSNFEAASVELGETKNGPEKKAMLNR